MEPWKYYQGLCLRSVIQWSRAQEFERKWEVHFDFDVRHSVSTICPPRVVGTLVFPRQSDSVCLAPTLRILLLPSGLPSRCRGFSCPAVFSSCRRALPGSVPRVAACVQRPGQPLRSQVQSQGLGPRGGAGPQGAGWDSLLHRVLGHVHQWSLPGNRNNRKNFYVWTLTPLWTPETVKRENQKMWFWSFFIKRNLKNVSECSLIRVRCVGLSRTRGFVLPTEIAKQRFYVVCLSLCLFYRLWVAIMSWGAQQRRTTVVSAVEMAPPADWCGDTTNPSMLQEKVKNISWGGFCFISGRWELIILTQHE